MSSGIRIQPEHASKFNDICDALEAANIDYAVWNAEVMLIPNYNGPIDLNCHDQYRWDEFERIVKSFTAPRIVAEGAD